MSSYQPPSVTCHDSSEVLSLSGASQESKDEESVSVYFNPSPPLLLRMPRCRSLLWSSLTTGLALAVVLVVGVTSDLVIGWVLVSFFSSTRTTKPESCCWSSLEIMAQHHAERYSTGSSFAHFSLSVDMYNFVSFSYTPQHESYVVGT